MFNFGVVIPTMVVSFSNFSTNLITVVGSTFCDALGSEQIKCIIKCFYCWKYDFYVCRFCSKSDVCRLVV